MQSEEQELIQAWREALDALHDEGGQSSEGTGFLIEDIREYEAELRVGDLAPEYHCPDGQYCMYGCPAAIWTFGA